MKVDEVWLYSSMIFISIQKDFINTHNLKTARIFHLRIFMWIEFYFYTNKFQYLEIMSILIKKFGVFAKISILNNIVQMAEESETPLNEIATSNGKATPSNKPAQQANPVAEQQVPRSKPECVEIKKN